MTDDEVLASASSCPAPAPGRAVGRRGRGEGRRPAGQGLRLPGRRRGRAEAARPRTSSSCAPPTRTPSADAPYLAERHWVRVVLDGTVPDDEVRELV